MKAVEFNTKLIKNTIKIPFELQKELKHSGTKNIRVIVLIEDTENNDEGVFIQETKQQFLNGYAESDSIYD